MRENLGIFRGKDTIEHKWRYGNLTVHGDTAQIWEDTEQGLLNYLVDPETVGEFTGMTNEDGTRIFEGDIVENIETGMRALVQYFKEHAAFMLWCRSETVNQIEYVGEISFFEVQVIGNIHDNPELLERGKS